MAAALAQSGYLEEPGGTVLGDRGGSVLDDHFHFTLNRRELNQSSLLDRLAERIGLEAQLGGGFRLAPAVCKQLLGSSPTSAVMRRVTANPSNFPSFTAWSWHYISGIPFGASSRWGNSSLSGPFHN
jgi:hypothetical protein